MLNHTMVKTPENQNWAKRVCAHVCINYDNLKKNITNKDSQQWHYKTHTKKTTGSNCTCTYQLYPSYLGKKETNWLHTNVERQPYWCQKSLYQRTILFGDQFLVGHCPHSASCIPKSWNKINASGIEMKHKRVHNIHGGCFVSVHLSYRQHSRKDITNSEVF